MPDYRDIKEPTRLATYPLSDEEKAIVEAGGNEAAAGVLTPEGHPTQLNIWWRNDETYVMPYPADKEPDGWKLNGYISPEHVREEYMHRVHPEPIEPEPQPEPEPAPVATSEPPADADAE